MALLLICSMGVFTVSAENTLEITQVIYPENQDYYKSGTDALCIKGTCGVARDVVIRVYDNQNVLVYTDVLLSTENKDGNYEFSGFVLPATFITAQLEYKVVVSTPATKDKVEECAEKTILVNPKGSTPDPIPGGNTESLGEIKGWNKIDEEKDPKDDPETEDSNGAKQPQELASEDPLNHDVIESAAEVTTAGGASSLINKATAATPEEAMEWESTRNTIAVSVETMMANISSKKIVVSAATNKLILRDSSVTSSDLKKYTSTEKSLNQSLDKNKITLNRELSKEYIINTTFRTTKPANITIYKGFIEKLETVGINTLTINDKNFRVSYSLVELKEMIGEEEFTSFDIDTTAMTGTTKKLTVNFNTDKTSSVKISFPGLDGDSKYMAIVDEQGNPVGGRYNPATGAIEAKINANGVYQIVNNEKDFADIKNKSEEMQESIKILAAKGIIEGTSETTFSPDSTITRAEIAALLLRVLSQVDPNADGEFDDVKQTDWFYGTAGSARKYGMIKGFEDNTFRGNNIIEKDQILTISSRVLQKEMRYKAPANIEEWLTFSDSDKIAEWARNDIALASMANIITRSEDNTIKSTEPMTRGDAALIIMRLFYKIW